MNGVTLAFESKAPHTTPWLSVEYPVGEAPEELLAQLSTLGWEDDGLRRAPPIDGRQEVALLPPAGTGLFGGWSEDEARRHMPAIRRVMRQYGYDRVPWNRLELADLI